MVLFVTGVNGQLGHDVMNELARRGYEGVGSDLLEGYSGIQDMTPVCSMPYVSMDITNQSEVKAVINKVSPDVVIHCAAWTAVDAAEDEDKKDQVYQVNVIGTKNIARACKELDCKMVYLSTDYVFDGQGSEPWRPDDSNYHPINFYGTTKLLGEQEIRQALEQFFILRISWVFGNNGKNFIKTMLQVGKRHSEIKVVHDQIGTPTYTFDLARLIIDMAETDRYGYYHVTNEGGYISWYEFTKEIFRQAVRLGRIEYSDEVITVTPVTSQEYGLSKASRPANSMLDKSKLIEQGFTPLPDWKDAVSRYLADVLPTIDE